jgi:hypothetical protein
MKRLPVISLSMRARAPRSASGCHCTDFKRLGHTEGMATELEPPVIIAVPIFALLPVVVVFVGNISAIENSAVAPITAENRAGSCPLLHARACIGPGSLAFMNGTVCVRKRIAVHEPCKLKSIKSRAMRLAVAWSTPCFLSWSKSASAVYFFATVAEFVVSRDSRFQVLVVEGSDLRLIVERWSSPWRTLLDELPNPAASLPSSMVPKRIKPPPARADTYSWLSRSVSLMPWA